MQSAAAWTFLHSAVSAHLQRLGWVGWATLEKGHLSNFTPGLETPKPHVPCFHVPHKTFPLDPPPHLSQFIFQYIEV